MFFLAVKRLALRAGQRQGGVFRLPPPYLWTPLSPQRVKGCSPLTIPKKKSKPKNASRCAKTGCDTQRPLRALSGTRVLLTAASRMRAVAKQTLGAATRRFPRLESSGCFSGSLLARKRELSLTATALCPAHRRASPLKETLPPRHLALLFYYTPKSPHFCDQVPKASISRRNSTLQGPESVLYFL